MINNEETNKVQQDLNEIARHGLKAKIQTDEGKIHYMLYCLEQYILNEEITKVKFLYNHFNKSENKLSFEMSIKYSETLIKMEKLVGRNYNNGLKLSKKDTIIYNSYIGKKKEELEKDLLNIEKLGITATPNTTEGKIHYMMYLLSTFIKKNQYENVANIYLKLKDPIYKMTEELTNQYAEVLLEMTEIVNKLDLIKLQFTKFYNQMPPLNQKGFREFDDWQKDTINNINNDKSTIICAPTSAGKSVISGYVVTKGRSLYIVPTDALAWQVASFIGGIMNIDVPILTLTYQSIPKREELIKLLNNSQAIVGTSELIVNYLPFIKSDFKWVILDEIHMMGKPEGSAMELISKILQNSSFLCLSATIGNLEELQQWYELITNKKMDTIVCDKRYFNLQRYFYNDNNNKFEMLNPLSLVNVNEIENGIVAEKTLNATPLDTWSLVTKLLKYNIELNELDPYNYFGQTELIELTKTYEYFNKLILFMVENYYTFEKQIKNIMNEYSNYDFDDHNVSLVNIIDNLKNNNLFPAIIFQQNNISCLDIVRKTAEELELKELLKYPNLRKERVQVDKETKRVNKKKEKELLKNLHVIYLIKN